MKSESDDSDGNDDNMLKSPMSNAESNSESKTVTVIRDPGMIGLSNIDA